MAGINGIKPIINLLVTKLGARYVTKPEVVSIFKADLASLRPAFDTFERKTNFISIEDVKKLFQMIKSVVVNLERKCIK